MVERVVTAVQRDLSHGTWDARHGDLRKLDEYDAGLGLVVNTLGSGVARAAQHRNRQLQGQPDVTTQLKLLSSKLIDGPPGPPASSMMGPQVMGL